MNEETKTLIQAASWLVASVGGLVAAFKAIREMHEKNRISSRELRWAQSKQAKELIDETCSSPFTVSALRMLDWSGRSYVTDKETVVIKFADIGSALRIKNLSFEKKEQYIRDCFDALFDQFGRFEHYVSNELVTFVDLADYFRYYVGCMNRFHDEFEIFLGAYHFHSAIAFLERFDEWKTRAQIRTEAEFTPQQTSNCRDPES